MTLLSYNPPTPTLASLPRVFVIFVTQYYLNRKINSCYQHWLATKTQCQSWCGGLGFSLFARRYL